MSIIGKVSATQGCPTSADDIAFWLGDDVVVAPFDLVAAKNADNSTTVGVIREIYHVTDSPNHIASYVSSDFGITTEEVMTERLGTTYATVEVMSNNKEVYMPLRDGTRVSFASEEEIRQALGIDGIPEKRRIPAGFLRQSNGTTVPVFLDSAFLLGPEGAHLNMSGISGLATKTSYIMFLLQAISQFEKSQDTATIIFNVKGNDLLSIDLPANQLSDGIVEKWKHCGLEAKPFDKVKYCFPFTYNKDKKYANTWCPPKRVDDLKQKGLSGNYIYTYKHDRSKIDLLMSNIDDSTMSLDSIRNAILNDTRFEDINDWCSLKNELDIRCATGNQHTDKTITVQSWRKFKRILDTFILQNEGIFQDCMSEDKEKNQVHLSQFIGNIRGGETIVVDIASIPEQQKCLVFGDVIRTVYSMKTEGGGKCPERIVIFVDELNKYAPAGADKSPILGDLLEITERGRSLGIILFSAEQFRSAIHSRVKGNCATNVYGRTNSVEVASSDYKFLPKSFTGMMTRLNKGHLILQHPIFRTLIKIVFPEPSYDQPKTQ